MAEHSPSQPHEQEAADARDSAPKAQRPRFGIGWLVTIGCFLIAAGIFYFGDQSMEDYRRQELKYETDAELVHVDERETYDRKNNEWESHFVCTYRYRVDGHAYTFTEQQDTRPWGSETRHVYLYRDTDGTWRRAYPLEPLYLYGGIGLFVALGAASIWWNLRR